MSGGVDGMRKGFGALSALLIRGFQVAASPEGGVHAAVQFLAEYGADAPA